MASGSRGWLGKAVGLTAVVEETAIHQRWRPALLEPGAGRAPVGWAGGGGEEEDWLGRTGKRAATTGGRTAGGEVTAGRGWWQRLVGGGG